MSAYKYCKHMYKPLIVQSDMTLLLETENETYEAARDNISAFAEMLFLKQNVAFGLTI